MQTHNLYKAGDRGNSAAAPQSALALIAIADMDVPT